MFVANLDFKLSGRDLENIVANELGEDVIVRARIATVAGRSKGFGHLDFQNAEYAADAMIKLTGLDILGRTLTVEVANGGLQGRPSGSAYNPQGSNPDRLYLPNTDSGTGPYSLTPQYSVFLGNLAYDVDADLIEEMVGDIIGPDVLQVSI